VGERERRAAVRWKRWHGRGRSRSGNKREQKGGRRVGRGR